jgi:glycosyltransferase involved in cell wall biosynthesis
MMARVLIISPEQYIGGSGIYVAKILRHLIRRHDLRLLLHPSDEAIQYLQQEVPGAAITTMEMTYRHFVQLLIKLRRLIHQQQIEMMHINGRRLVVLAPFIKLFCPKVKILSTFHSTYFNSEERLVKAFALWLLHLVPVHCCDCVIVVSEKIYRERKWQLLPGRKIRLIKNGIDVEHFMFSDEIRKQFRQEIRQQYDLNHAVVIGEVARLVRGKGQHILLEAIARCRQKGYNFKALLVGEGPNRTELESLSRHLQIEPSIIFIGHQSDTRPFLAAMDVFVLPSLNEGLPLSLLEAMASGLPVVAARIGGIPEVIADGRTGLLVPPNDAETLALRLQELCENPTLRKRLACEAQAFVQVQFDQKKMLALHEAVYDELLSA